MTPLLYEVLIPKKNYEKPISNERPMCRGIAAGVTLIGNG